ncbi:MULTISPECIES: tRNA (guanosine(37)-N1)-methyltransferase TrmD [Limnochorda]|uniref:tRNA (guanosine(37)-N1)-methyltransferase TrmD n=1 Tax=Limnochorda TaxID=1676651 RepID=UPI0017FCFF34|nr:tRNA (guanosine(37)-N1)-methyltransferase TrmD [Limnochorda pilosa]MBO2487008.1 tRNA (guanosine(37)-N1)-methyltransferase TrmD [Bacillota bacterium]MBO2518194.1 tRNA (guanosine(37)-N1)-methyltransferase TrmD [Bacillota bacterium]NMA70334.1 tRNA (guanosine(37)-N1)-methyltransferase TrmD [Bacillota bacterium]
MLIDVITIFPEFFQGPLDVGMMQRAREKGLLQVRLWQLRDFTRDRHRTVDDTPYGGGAGMVMKPEPLVEALEAVRAQGPPGRAILLTPQGRVMDQAWAQERAKEERLILLCGRYEGVDERVRAFVDEELSVGDYVLTGGEYAALIVIDAVTRLVPGVLGSSASPVEESFSDGLLEYPQYTRPPVFRGMEVPQVLTTGNHQEIARWRRRQALYRTWQRRPDLLAQASLTPEERALVERWREAQGPSQEKGNGSEG